MSMLIESTASPLKFPFTEIMDSLVRVGKEIGEERLIVYRWRPNQIQLESGKGSLYHSIGETPHTPADIYHDQDDLLITARIGMRHSDVEDEMALLEVLVSEYITRIDPALKRIRPLGTVSVKRAWRTSMRMLEDEFNGIPVLAVEFPLTFTIHRMIVPSDQ